MKVKITQIARDRFVVETAHTGKPFTRSKELSKDQTREHVRQIFSAAIEQRIAEAEQAFANKQKGDGDLDFVEVKDEDSVLE